MQSNDKEADCPDFTPFDRIVGEQQAGLNQNMPTNDGHALHILYGLSQKMSGQLIKIGRLRFWHGNDK
jgi:hypothetical protein